MRLAGGGGVGWWFLLSCLCLACCLLSVRSRLPFLCLLGFGLVWLAPLFGLVWSVSRRGLGVVWRLWHFVTYSLGRHSCFPIFASADMSQFDAVSF